MPGHKRLKLWPEGIVLAGAETREVVASFYPKYFADPPAWTVSEALPLAELIFLETADEPAVLPISAGERIARLQDDHYTTRLFERASNLTRPQRFMQLAAIAERLPMRRLARPFDHDSFEEGLAFIFNHIFCKEPK